MSVRFNLGWDCYGRRTSGSARLAQYFEDKASEIAVWREGDLVVFLEYLHSARATRAKFSAGWGGTGDLTARDDEGFFWYRGRTDDVIKSAGYRIGSAEIADCLLKHPAIANAAVIGVPDPQRGDAVNAFVVLTAGSAPSEGSKRQIQDDVRTRLAPYREIEFIDALPMTATGKIQRRVLRERSRALEARPGF